MPLVKIDVVTTNRIVLHKMAAAMAFVAATLAIDSILHLSGSGAGSAAGIPDAIIGAVLTWRRHRRVARAARARITGLVTTGLAIFGFLVGLTFTARGDLSRTLPITSQHCRS
jgi:hypothetical protein